MSGKRARMPYSGEVQTSPWDAMLTEVRRSAYRAEWVEARIEDEIAAEQALDDQRHDWDPVKFEQARQAQSRELREWVKLGREERAHGAQVAHRAVSAGLSERYIESVQAEARMIAGVLQRALQAAELTSEQWEAATGELRVALAEVGRELQARHASVAPYVAERPEIEG